MTGLDPSELAALTDRLRGDVLGPADAAYDEARQGWNLAIDQRPAVVVRAAEADDVVAAMEFAAGRALPVAVQATGHGTRIPADAALLIETSAMNAVEVDPSARTARIGAGARLQDVIAAAEPHGLVAPVGYAPTVGAVGYTLGGGHGWYARAHGLAVDAVRALDVVTATGEPRRLHPGSDELAWGMLGYGAGLAVTTGMELALAPVDELSGGRLTWPIQRAGEVLATYAEISMELPESVSLDAALLQGTWPATGTVRSIAVDGVALGPPERLMDAVAPLRRIPDLQQDSIAARRPRDLYEVTDDWVAPTHQHYHGELLDRLDERAVDAIVRTCATESAPWTSLRIRRLGGAVAGAREGTSAIGPVDASHLFLGVTVDADPLAGQRAATAADELRSALAGRLSGAAIPNFVGNTAAAAGHRPREAERLQALKSRVDPADLLRFHLPLTAA